MSKVKNISEYLDYIGEQHPEAKTLILGNFMNNDGVFVSRAWMALLDGNAYRAMVMGRIMFWADINVEKRIARMTYMRDGHLWMVKTHQDIADETGISSVYTVRNALNELRDKEFVVIENHHSPFHRTDNGGQMKVSHIRPNWKRIMEALNEWLEDQKPSGSTLEVQPKSTLEVQPIETTLEVQSLYQVDTGRLSDSLASSEQPDDTTGKSRYARGKNFAGSEEVPAEGEAVTDTEVVDESTLPDFVRFMMDTCQRAKWKNVSKSMRHQILNVALEAWSDEKKTYIYIAPIAEQYDKDLVYAAWIREVVAPKMKKQTGGRIAKGKFLDRASDYSGFQTWLKTPHGKQFASRVKMGTVVKDAPGEVEVQELPLIE